MSARESALNVLKNCRAEGGWVNASLKEQLARDRLDRRDAALATRLACGNGTVLEIRQLQAQGGKRMAAPDYFRGHPLEI